MIVCLCAAPKGLSDSAIREAVRAGHTTRSAIYSYHRKRPSCGSCKDMMAEIVSEELDKIAAEQAATAT